MSDEPRRIGRRALFGRLLSRAPQDEAWVRVHRTAMACRFEVRLPSEDARHVDGARAALDAVAAIEDQLAGLHDVPAPLSADLFLLLSLCRELSVATGGAFDPASAALSRCWGFLERRPRVPSDEAIEAARERSGMDKVVLDDLARTVRFSVPGVELDLGAVGKGWALDRVAAALRVRRVPRALLTAGGRTHRGWGGEAWELLVAPGREALATVRLRDAALGTSAAGERMVEAGGRRFGAVLDPRTGRPAEGVRSASVVATEAAVADALSAAFLVGGPQLAASFCASRPGTAALLVLESAPREVRVYGRRDGLAIEPSAGVSVVEESA